MNEDKSLTRKLLVRIILLQVKLIAMYADLIILE